MCKNGKTGVPFLALDWKTGNHFLKFSTTLSAVCRAIGVWKCPSAHEPDHPGLPWFKEGDRRRKTLTYNRREGKLTKHPEEKL